MTLPERFAGPARFVLLLAVCTHAVVKEIAPETATTPVAGAALLVWMLLDLRKMALVAQVTVLAALLLATIAWTNGTLNQRLLFTAIDRAAFFTWFILSMDLLRAAAFRSRMVREAGQALIEQPPGRRYLMLTLGGHFFALLMNLGSVTLLGTVAASARASARDARIAEIRLRRMSLAITRGFAAGTLWLPTSITVQIVVAAIPGFHWQDIAIQGIATAAGFMAIGWLLDRLSYPAPSPGPMADATGAPLTKLLPIVMLTAGILIAATALATLSGLRPIAALLCVVPCFGLGWIAIQKRAAGGATAARLWVRTMRRRVVPEIASLRSEVGILASAGFIAVLLPLQIDTVALAELIRDNHLGGPLLLIPLMWLLTAAAMLGLNPIVTVAACLEILVNLPGVALPAPALALAGTAAWCMATGVSPLGATLRIMGRCINRPPARIGLVWNRSYTIWIGVAASAALIIMT